MNEIILLDRHDNGAATTYYQNQCWKRVADEWTDATTQWLNDYLETASTEMHQFLELAYEDHKIPAPVRHPLVEWERKAGQRVFSPAFGFGKIVATIGSKIVVKFGKRERVVGAQDLSTRAQAEIDWHT